MTTVLAPEGLVLGIESSCDETAASVVAGGRTVLSTVVASQTELHATFGGVVPELAGRAHLEQIVPVVRAALREAGVDDPASQLGAVAVTVGPGLIGALVVGVAHAKALSLAWDLPFVGVNHLEGHLYASLLEDASVEPPFVVLLVSGGHTLLLHVVEHGRYELLGRTIDDAAGEAFDKVARLLGLGYPGGPAIDRVAPDGDPTAARFPRGLVGAGFDFTFSGIKSSVQRFVRANPAVPVADVAACFQEAVVEVLVTKTLAAAASVGATAVCLAGGVAANSRLRADMATGAAAHGLDLYLPSRAMCTDNAAMIAAAGAWQLLRQGPSPLDTAARPQMPIVPAAIKGRLR